MDLCAGKTEFDFKQSTERFVTEQKKIEVTLNDFSDQPHAIGRFLRTPVFTCFGNRLFIKVYPGGKKEQYGDHLAAFLVLLDTDKSIDMQCTFTVPAIKRVKTTCWCYRISKHNNVHGIDKMIHRDRLIDLIPQDVLTIIVDIRVLQRTSYIWSPQTSMSNDIETLWNDESQKDISFVVNGTTFKAHRLILMARAPELAKLAENVQHDIEIELTHVDESTFNSFLQFVYSDKQPAEMNTQALEFLSMADRFGCKRLKLLAEAELTKSLDSFNAAELLLLADAHSCAQLKESAIEFITKNIQYMITTPGWTKLSKCASLLAEIMEFSIEANTKNDSFVTVSEIRYLCTQNEIDVDGTKETLYKRLLEKGILDDDNELRPCKRVRMENL
jgi:speckle-type POZ protein